MVERRTGIFPVNPVSAGSRSYGREKPVYPRPHVGGIDPLYSQLQRHGSPAMPEAMPAYYVCRCSRGSFGRISSWLRRLRPGHVSAGRAFDHELEFAELEAAQPVAPVRPGPDTTIVAEKPRLTIAASNDPSAATSEAGNNDPSMVAHRRLAGSVLPGVVMDLRRRAACRHRGGAIPDNLKLLETSPTADQEPITPIPLPPAADPLKLALGERLFTDTRLSAGGNFACCVLP